MKSKIMANGQLEVFEDGAVYRIKNGERKLVRSSASERHYKMATAYINGEQQKYYIHRMVAEAFIPNPEHKECVRFKDGNPNNVSVDNLEWVTQKELSKISGPKIAAAKAAKAKPCAICKKATLCKNGVCNVCNREQLQKEKEAVKLNQIRELMGRVNPNVCTPKEYQAVVLRSQGHTLNEISEMLHCSRQNIDQKIKTALIKSTVGVKNKNYKNTAQIKNRLLRRKANLQCLEEQRKQLMEEIGKLETMLHMEDTISNTIPVQQKLQAPIYERGTQKILANAPALRGMEG